MRRLKNIDPDRLAAAHRVLNDDQFITWGMAEVGVTQRAIAHYRKRSKGSVSDMLARARQLVEEELHAAHPHP